MFSMEGIETGYLPQSGIIHALLHMVRSENSTVCPLTMPKRSPLTPSTGHLGESWVVRPIRFGNQYGSAQLVSVEGPGVDAFSTVVIDHGPDAQSTLFCIILAKRSNTAPPWSTDPLAPLDLSIDPNDPTGVVCPVLIARRLTRVAYSLE
ncbi:hypothetical protein J2T11_000129 [Paenarthrobacter nicotinovorans]|nr:hypothetical protein [Paenarthrobacter nicotinovorans]